MAEELITNKSLSKESQYQQLLPQIKNLISAEADLIANLANISAAIKQTFEHLWVGFYIVKDDELVLGPFQGPIACTRIKKGKGVCGKAWNKKETVIVPNVEQFPGHISCNSSSKSEIVLPVLNTKGEVKMVLDIDSAALNTFDTTDKKYLSLILELIQL